MKRWISVLAMLVILAACARQQPTNEPTAPDQPIVGKLLVPIQHDGIELLVTEVASMKTSSGKHNFLVSFELTNLNLDQYQVTKELFSFSDGVGEISKPGLFNIHAPEKTNMDEYVLKRGETQPFAVGVFVPSGEGMTFLYQPSATSEPIRVSLLP